MNILEIGLQQGIERGMKQGLEQGLKQGVEQGLHQGITALIETCQELGVSRTDTLTKLSEKFSLSESEALEYLQKHWHT